MFCMFTKRGEYAHRAAMVLGSMQNGYMKAKDLAERESIPLPFLKKLIGALREKGIVETRTGRHGGVALRADPAKVSILDIVRAVEKKSLESPCPFPADHCRYRANCQISSEWQNVLDKMTEVLGKITLTDLVRTRTEALRAGWTAPDPKPAG